MSLLPDLHLGFLAIARYALHMRRSALLPRRKSRPVPRSRTCANCLSDKQTCAWKSGHGISQFTGDYLLFLYVYTVSVFFSQSSAGVFTVLQTEANVLYKIQLLRMYLGHGVRTSNTFIMPEILWKNHSKATLHRTYLGAGKIPRWKEGRDDVTEKP